ncbi:MAG TPA: threonylcarbamoyl-AMP synthase, partial [Nitrospirae bacterium]|nr:threonylcarbamoyl-AMP synthase [Nitrospirota bacterium]
MLELKMIKLSLNTDHVDKIAAEALRVLKMGGIIAYPTESFYALGVIAGDENAVNKLFLLKKRPSEKAMPVIVGSLDIL